MDKKIFCACLSTKIPATAKAGWKDGILHVVEVTTLPAARFALDEKLLPQLIACESKNFDVLVDEVTPRLSVKHGRLARLSDLDPLNGQPIIVSALKAYGELRNQQAITYPKNSGSRYEIPDSLVDEERDGNGQSKYHIDWESLKPEMAALLLCVYSATSATMCESLYMSTLFGALNESGHAEAVKSRFDAVTVGFDRQAAGKRGF